MAQRSSNPNPASELEKFIKRAGAERYVLRLYVVGSTPKSAAAIANVRTLCEEHLAGRYDLEVIDLYQQPAEAKNAQIIAAPTLVRQLPKPPRRFIGQLANKDRVLVGLKLQPQAQDDFESNDDGTQWIKL